MRRARDPPAPVAVDADGLDRRVRGRAIFVISDRRRCCPAPPSPSARGRSIGTRLACPGSARQARVTIRRSPAPMHVGGVGLPASTPARGPAAGRGPGRRRRGSATEVEPAPVPAMPPTGSIPSRRARSGRPRPMAAARPARCRGPAGGTRGRAATPATASSGEQRERQRRRAVAAGPRRAGRAGRATPPAPAGAAARRRDPRQHARARRSGVAGQAAVAAAESQQLLHVDLLRRAHRVASASGPDVRQLLAQPARAPGAAATSPSRAGSRARPRSPPPRAPSGSGRRRPAAPRRGAGPAPRGPRRGPPRRAGRAPGRARVPAVTSPRTARTARSSMPARRPSARRRFRASLPTTWRSQGRNGSPARNRASAR